MSLDAVISRIQEIESMTGATPTVNSSQANNQAQGTGSTFATQLQNAQGAAAPSTAPAISGNTVSARMVNLARAELAKGVHETPDGSNDSPDIARYRTATVGAVKGGAWCAYFVSYIAKMSGAPIGAHGEGMGYVPNIISWAKSTNRFVPPSGQAKPGDLILFSQHIGIVESVNKDGSLTTIEGNHSNKVAEVHRSRSEIVGFARMG
jgi:hypothetical protein